MFNVVSCKILAQVWKCPHVFRFILCECQTMKRSFKDASCAEKRCGAAWRMFSAWISKKGATISVRWPGVAKRASRLDKSQSAQAFNLSSLSQVRPYKTMGPWPIVKVDNFAVPFVWVGKVIPKFLDDFPISTCVPWLAALLPSL